jgi:hypothetical protein
MHIQLDSGIFWSNLKNFKVATVKGILHKRDTMIGMIA